MQDFLPVVAFIATYFGARWLGYQQEAIYAATVALMLAVSLEILWLKINKKEIEQRKLWTAIVILLMGAITLIFHNPLFVQLKPTVLNIIIAIILIGSQLLSKANLIKKILNPIFDMPDKYWQKLNIIWAVFFIFEGILNAVVAFTMSETFWVAFKIWGLMGITIIFIVAHVFLLRKFLRHDNNEEHG